MRQILGADVPQCVEDTNLPTHYRGVGEVDGPLVGPPGGEQDGDVRQGLAESGQGECPAPAGHVHVEQHDITIDILYICQHFVTILRLSYN